MTGGQLHIAMRWHHRNNSVAPALPARPDARMLPAAFRLHLPAHAGHSFHVGV